jgi:hypothetical protein
MSYITITNLATEIWEDINQPSNLSSTSIETKLLTSGNLGKFDTLINGCHFIDYDYTNSGQCISPDLSGEEQAIYKIQYLMEYYQRKSIDIFSFSDGQTAGSWVSLKEGDTTISRSNPTEIAKFYKDLYKETKMDLDKLAESYKRNGGTVKSVDYLNIENSSAKSSADQRTA